MVDSSKMRRILFAVLAFSFFGPQAFAQDTGKTAKAPSAKVGKFGNWTVICPPAGDKSGARCVAQLSLIDSKRKMVLVAWRIGYGKDNKFMTDIVTPTEVFIAPGVRLEFGKAPPLTLPYVSCGLQGCLSRKMIDSATLQSLKKITSVSLSLAATNGKILQLKLDTAGIDQALKAIGGS
jgi:invasion protein IalB